MKRSVTFLLVGFLLGTAVSTAFAKFEGSAQDAVPMVIYGKNGTTLVPILVDSNGAVQLQ